MKRKLDRPRVVQKAHQLYPLRGRTRADLPKSQQTVVALAPNVGSVGKHRCAVTAKPFCARIAAVSVGQKLLAVVPRKFPLCSNNSHPAVQAIGLAVLDRSTCPVAQYLVARKLEVHFPLQGWSRETHPVRLVHQRDDTTSTAKRLVSGDLFHLESLKRSRNAVLSDVVQEGFLGDAVKHVLCRSRWKLLRHVAFVVRVGAGLAALHQNVPASIRAGHVGGLIQIEELVA